VFIKNALRDNYSDAGLEGIDRRDKDTKGSLKVVFKGTAPMERTRIWCSNESIAASSLLIHLNV
jgi:hypothetical protein